MNVMKIFIVGVIAVAALMAGCNLAPSVARINTDPGGQAAKGYDTVAFFAKNAAVRGNPAYEYAWNGAKWFFSSEENLEKFKANPDAYSPQFGGYCVYSAAQGKLVEGNPEHYKVIDGKLYFCNNAEAKEAWEGSEDELIKKAEKFWAEIQAK